MGKYKRYKNSIEKFLSGDSGKRFFNFAYSIGAAIVIWGALFKILHLPGGNVMLSIGMGVEVVMFILTAFDRPAKEYHWEEVFPVLASKDPEDRPDFKNGGGIVINGNMAGENGIAVSGAEARRIAGLNTIYEIQLKSISSQLDNIDRVNVGLRNIREMYEGSMHDSSRYCEEVEKMTQYMAQLNSVYRNMLTAMTVNMYNQPVRQEQPQNPNPTDNTNGNA